MASDACSAGRVLVNDRKVKPSYDVKVGDVIKIQFGQKAVAVEVLSLEEHVKKEAAMEMYKEVEVD